MRLVGADSGGRRGGAIHPVITAKRLLATVACGLVALGAAAAPPEGVASADASLEAAVRERGLDPDLLIRPWRLGANSSRWLSRVAVDRRPADRLRVAFHQLLDDGGLGLEYNGAVTGTAEEVFSNRRANCLGFSLLVVGIARELGVEAGFFRVGRRESYRREGDLIFVAEHLTAGYEADGEAHLVEFNMANEVDYRQARRISDLTALTLFYSNRGAEELRDGAVAEAVRWLEVAVRLDAAEPAAWANLGVARRRLGDLAGAEVAYRRAIDVDAGHIPAYINLARVLRLRGERDAAREVLRLLDRSDNRNPWAYLALGDASLEDGRPGDARRYYRRAVRLGRGQAEPRAAMGLWALDNGDEGSARRWLRRARRIDQNEERTVKLEKRLMEHSPSPGATAAAGPKKSEREVES